MSFIKHFSDEGFNRTPEYDEGWATHQKRLDEDYGYTEDD